MTSAIDVRQQMIKGSKKTKIERYKWIIHDQPGEFSLVAKELLKIDMDYQRSWSEKKSLDLARAWSWAACGVIIAAQREDGSLFVVDGQHRVNAALRRADITDLPVLIFPMESVPTEARAFYILNVNRNNPKTVERFKALLCAGDEGAIKANAIIETSGYKVANSQVGSHLRCIASAMKLYRADPAIFASIFPLVAELHNGSMIFDFVLRGMWWIEKNATEPLTSKRWSKRLLAVGIEEINACVNRARNYAGPGDPIFGQAIIAAVNKGVRQKLTVGTAE